MWLVSINPLEIPLIASHLFFRRNINTNTTIKINLLRKTISWRMSFKDCFDLHPFIRIYMQRWVYIFFFGNSCVDRNFFAVEFRNAGREIHERGKGNNKHAKEKLNCDGGHKRCVFTQFSLRFFFLWNRNLIFARWLCRFAQHRCTCSSRI